MSPRNLPETLEATAARQPDAVAFKCDGAVLTYGELLDAANKLANTLSEHAIQRGDRVGIYLYKSLECAVSIYGIMRAGAAYVPVDPRARGDALAYVLNHCDISHIVVDDDTSRPLAGAAPEGRVACVIGGTGRSIPSGARHICWDEVGQAPAHPPPGGAGAEDVAYILHTSGSTGRPKAITHTHRSALAYAMGATEAFDVTPADVLSSHSPLHFDMSTFDYFSGVIGGACTVVIPEECTVMPASLAELIERERLTIWYSVPTALIELLVRGNLEARDLESLRLVKFGGEPFAPSRLTQLMSRLPQADFYNIYGPAEVNMCTYYRVPALPNEHEQSFVPIGRPWPLARTLVLGDDDEPVAAGQQGELVVSAETCMKGYWNEMGRTEAAFAVLADARGVERSYYRTGDLVRERGDGELEFLGRRDRQIKVRGYRVELDGVEAALAAHPDVTEAAVWVDEGGETLCGSALAAPRSEIDERALYAHARDVLPHYCVPQFLTIAAEFPRTSSGKIDRRALMARHGRGVDSE